MKNQFVFHVIGTPITKTNLDYCACAFAQKAYKFCKMMTERGHIVYHYGVGGSNPICTKNIDIITEEEFDQLYDYELFKKGEDYWKADDEHDSEDEYFDRFCHDLVHAIGANRQGKQDIVLPFFSWPINSACKELMENDFIVIEPGMGSVGYELFTPYRVFESYALYHSYCGSEEYQKAYDESFTPRDLLTPSNVIIPNYFDETQFVYNHDFSSRLKDPYFLYLGQVSLHKGVDIAIEASLLTGTKLKVAGQLRDELKDYEWPDNVEFLGYADVNMRKELMSNAVASFIPSQYLEPFGGVQIENLLCGTPTITSDWGAFVENNIHGVTGYRCRTMEDYVNAALKCLNGEINSNDCYQKGLEFTLENIAPRYEKYFNDVINIHFGIDPFALKE